MSLSDTSKTLIAIKKLVGKAHTSNGKDVANESLPTGITVASSTIIAQSVPVTTGSNVHYEVLSNSSNEKIAEFIRFDVSFIPGSDSASGRHGFELKLPLNYESNSNNPKAGTYPFVNGQSINITSGSLQLIPPSFSAGYEAKPYHASGGITQIPVLDSRDWNLDYFNGILFQQDPPAASINNPQYVDGFLFIGKMLTEALDLIPGDITSVIAGSGLAGGGTNGAVTLSVAKPFSRSKLFQKVSSQHPAGSIFTITGSDMRICNYNNDYIDLFLNGQLLQSGTLLAVGESSADYTVVGQNTVKFSFDIEEEDAVCLTLFPF